MSEEKNTVTIKAAKYPFVVACDQCRTEYLNWPGSTPCCGSIAYEVVCGEAAMTHPLVVGALAEGKDIQKPYAL